jgi:nitrate reductase gamma subunit
MIPYAPQWIAGRPAVPGMQAFFASALIAGLARMARRLSDPFVRSISTRDDYFFLGLLIVWLALSLLAAPNRPARSRFSRTFL